jgi:hypothetical protein
MSKTPTAMPARPVVCAKRLAPPPAARICAGVEPVAIPCSVIWYAVSEEKVYWPLKFAVEVLESRVSRRRTPKSTVCLPRVVCA